MCGGVGEGGEGMGGGDILMADENCFKMVMVRCMRACVCRGGRWGEGGGGRYPDG